MAKLTATSIMDIKDELIYPYVASNPGILEECDDYLDDFIQAKTNASFGLNGVVFPIPYKLKRLAIAWVCREVCSRKGGGSSAAYRGQDAINDRYSAKLIYFSRQVKELEEQITPGILRGGASNRVIGSVTLKRG